VTIMAPFPKPRNQGLARRTNIYFKSITWSRSTWMKVKWNYVKFIWTWMWQIR
jgi:hypothetical protein